LNKDSNGHRGFWNPVKIFVRALLGQWEKRDKVSDEIYLVNSQIVKNDLDDVADEPLNESHEKSEDKTQDDRN
jgi:hypothetical protein